MSRWRAAGFHLLISLALVALVWLLMLETWFPDGLIAVAGMNRFVMLLLGIDLCIGPLLTLVVYKTGKPRLKLDLAIIAVLQLGFFLYGLHAIWQARPVYLVGVVDRLSLVFANQIDTRGSNRALPMARPELVGVRLPSDPAVRDAITHEAFNGGADLDMRPAYYVPYAQAVAGLRTHARPFRSLRLTPAERRRLDDALRLARLPPERALVLPVMSSRRSGLALLAPDDLVPRRIVGLDGYEIFGRESKK